MITLKKLNCNARLSTDSYCFSADVYLNDIKIGVASDAGHGGCVDIDYDSAKGKALASKHYTNHTHDCDYVDGQRITLVDVYLPWRTALELAIGEAVTRELWRQDMMKTSRTKWLYFTEGGDLYGTSKKYPKPANALCDMSPVVALDMYIAWQQGARA